MYLAHTPPLQGSYIEQRMIYFLVQVIFIYRDLRKKNIASMLIH